MDLRSTLKGLCEAFNTHDLDRIMGFFADDCVLEMPRGDKPWGTRSEGKAEVRKALAARFEGLPDVPAFRQISATGIPSAPCFNMNAF